MTYRSRGYVFPFLVALAGAAGCDDDPAGPSVGVTVYEDPNFRGQGRTFDGNAFDLRDIRGPCGFAATANDGDWNDCISSIRVPQGWEATIYEDDEYRGDRLTLTSDVVDLDDIDGPCGHDWDDCITSLRVTAP